MEGKLKYNTIKRGKDILISEGYMYNLHSKHNEIKRCGTRTFRSTILICLNEILKIKPHNHKSDFKLCKFFVYKDKIIQSSLVCNETPFEIIIESLSKNEEDIVKNFPYV